MSPDLRTTIHYVMCYCLNFRSGLWSALPPQLVEVGMKLLGEGCLIGIGLIMFSSLVD